MTSVSNLFHTLFHILENQKDSLESHLVEANSLFFKALNSAQETSDEDSPSDESSCSSDIELSDDEFRGLTPKLTQIQKWDLKTSFVSTMSDKMGLTKMNKIFPEAKIKREMFDKSKDLDLGEFGILRSQNVTCVPQYNFVSENHFQLKFTPLHFIKNL